VINKPWADQKQPDELPPLGALPAELESAGRPEPEFGLVDVIEAFTAMRHEWRTQSRESREFAGSLTATADQILQLEQRMAEAIGGLQETIIQRGSDDTSRRLAETLAEIDHHLSHAVNAITTTEHVNMDDRDADSSDWTHLVDRQLERLGSLRRLLVRSFAGSLKAAIEAQAQRSADEVAKKTDAQRDGLQMLVERVRRMLTDQEVERIDTVGQPFDAEIMHAVDAVEASNCRSGHVAWQYSAAYRWRGKLIRYAEVRVAK
jgi:molecular chaperone GrpE